MRQPPSPSTYFKMLSRPTATSSESGSVALRQPRTPTTELSHLVKNFFLPCKLGGFARCRRPLSMHCVGTDEIGKATRAIFSAALDGRVIASERKFPMLLERGGRERGADPDSLQVAFPAARHPEPVGVLGRPPAPLAFHPLFPAERADASPAPGSSPARDTTHSR